MRVSELMKRQVRTIGPDEPIEAAAETLRRLRIHHLVVAREGEVLGVLSERDLRGCLHRDACVGDVMTEVVVTARPSMTVRQAANLLRGCSIGCLPVTEGKRLVGIITTTDLLELIGRGTMRPALTVNRWRTLQRLAGRSAKLLRPPMI